MSKSNIRKVEGIPLASVLIYNGILPYRVEAFDSDRPFFLFHVPQFDYEAMVAESTSKEITVLLSGMLDAVTKAFEYLGKARMSGVWTEVRNNE